MKGRLSFENYMIVVGGLNRALAALRTTEVWNGTTDLWSQIPAELPVEASIRGFVSLGNDLVCFAGLDDSLENRPRQTRFPELLADERVEIVITLLFEGLGNRRWISAVYECIRETNGRLIPRRMRYNNSSRANETARFKGTPEYSISSRNSYVRFSVKLQNSDIIMFSSSIAVYQDITQDVADAFSFAFMTCSSPFSALILESSICVSI
jgi:hypothetical protein